LDRLAPELYTADALNHMQGLPERMSMPRGARFRLEAHEGTANPRGGRGFDDRGLPNRTGEGFGSAAARGDRARAFDFHVSLLFALRLAPAGLASIGAGLNPPDVARMPNSAMRVASRHRAERVVSRGEFNRSVQHCL